MGENGDQEGGGDKSTPNNGNKGKKPIRMLFPRTIPHYLQNMHLVSSTSRVREASPSQVQETPPTHSSMNETLPSSTTDPDTQSTTLHGPPMQPFVPPQSQPSSSAAGSSAPCSITTSRRYAPRRNISTDAPRDNNDRFIVVLGVDNKFIDHHIATVVTGIFQQYLQPVAYTFQMLSDAMLEKYWEEFKKRCVWDTTKYSDDIIRKAFISKLQDRYKGTLNRIRKAGTRPIWCPEDVWEPWQRMWGTPEFKRKSELAKKERVGEDGVAKGTHTGGSYAHAKSAQKLENELGKKPTADQVFLWGHTHEHDGVSFVNNRCKVIQENYVNNITQQVEQMAPEMTPEEVGEQLNEIEAFYVAIGGINRDGRIYGLGSAASNYFRDRMSHPRSARAATSSTFGGASTSTANVQPDIQSIQERLNGFNAERARFIEHLERVDERQERMEQSLDLITLRVGANEVSELRLRLIEVETQLGPSLRQLQTALSRLEALERLDRT
ncbi:uncharacterized protein [Euphorbia lathyris]|uniref:uncharacterized protein isoform X2 n=1 Tax=Euphorbia lathyris TaxID=212925 RepID=UPI00331445D2